MAIFYKMSLLPRILFLILCCWCLFFQNSLQAQYAPYFKNYDLSQYSAGNQNWGISKAADGRLYVANNKGLLEYDGLKWTLRQLPNKTTIRSVLATEDKIFTGSYEEFGFWQRNKYGQLKYTSLSEKLKSTEFLNEEFWQIIRLGDAVIFRSFLNIYIFQDGQINKVKPPSTVLSCDVVDGVLYISTLRHGIFTLINQQLHPFLTDERIVNAKIVSIARKDGELFISTSLRGVFTYKHGVLSPWNTEISAIIKEQQLNAFSEMNNGNMIFGTIKNGVYVTDTNGKLLFHIHKENGLINNTVLAQYVDDDDQLWLGLDNGLASADLSSPYLFYNDVSGSLGAVYDVIKYQNTVYIGSNTGLYYLDADNSLQFVEGSQGQVWDLKEVEGDLLCGHNNGTYLVRNKKLKLISPYTGGWVLRKVLGQPHTYIQGTYAGLVKFHKSEAGWDVKHLGRTTIPSRFLVFEDAYTGWVAHAYKGIYRVKFNSSYDSLVEIKNYDQKGLWSPYNARIYKLKNDICITSNDGWQKYEPLLDSILPFPLLNQTFGKNSYIISENNIPTLAVRHKKSIDFKAFPDNGSQASLSDKYFKRRLIVGYENISKLHDSLFALNLNNGFLLFNTAFVSNHDVLETPYFESIKIDKERIDIEAVTSVRLPNDFKSFSVSMTAPKSKDYYFEYALATVDSFIWYKIENDKLEFSNINDGKYEFLFRTSNSAGEVSAPRRLMVTVLPPWYKSIIGYVLYALLVLFVMGMFYLLHKRKIKRQQRFLHKQFEQEQEKILREKTIENDRRIVELKNDALKNEVKLKSKQLANTAMALVKKNEMLLELKKDITDNRTNFDNQFSYKKIINKIDTSIRHKDEWKVFEHNFNQVHEDFFHLLKDQHPKLTARDLRICAYIKMNLSTKEIAPLLNISVRGVETQRYRLRSKLDLEAEQSLSDYLVNFK